jgi:hypothetical protein
MGKYADISVSSVTGFHSHNLLVVLKIPRRELLPVTIFEGAFRFEIRNSNLLQLF